MGRCLGTPTPTPKTERYSRSKTRPSSLVNHGVPLSLIPSDEGSRPVWFFRSRRRTEVPSPGREVVPRGSTERVRSEDLRPTILTYTYSPWRPTVRPSGPESRSLTRVRRTKTGRGVEHPVSEYRVSTRRVDPVSRGDLSLSHLLNLSRLCHSIPCLLPLHRYPWFTLGPSVGWGTSCVDRAREDPGESVRCWIRVRGQE